MRPLTVALALLAVSPLCGCGGAKKPAGKTVQPTSVPAADVSVSAQAPTDAAAASAASAPAPKKSSWAPRTPAQIRKEGNHLASQKSVYLLQHAKNPLEWYPWGQEALQRARDEDKPIFLSIGYASCHWCHVMEHEVFEDDEVAEFMNANFVCIKVDREERPDLDTVYMDAVQKLTGRGGWPMSVFLTPSLKPFFGGTYFPKRRFMPLARNILTEFKDKRNEVEEKSAGIYADLSKQRDLSPGQQISVADVKSVVDRAAGFYDKQYGGLGQRQKFPTPIRWQLMLHAYRKWGAQPVADAVRKTLDEMAAGGIHDHLAGGFHRYTVEKTWTVPHFEKMLYDNGQLAVLYLEAGATFDDARYREVGHSILQWMIEEMYEPGSGFFSSYDADSGGHEGTFYIWTQEELESFTNPADGRALAELLGVTPGGNFEGKSILTRRVTPAQVAAKVGRPVAEVAGLFEKWRPKLREVRAKRVWPGLDKKVVTAWNGLALSGFAKGYAMSGKAIYRETAEAVVAYLRRVHRKADGSLCRASNGGVAVADGVLDDYTFLAVGLLDLFETTGNQAHMQWAIELVDYAHAHFAAPEGAWYVTDKGTEAPMGRKVDPHDAVRPSGTSQMLRALLRIGALTGDPKRIELVERTLGTYKNMVRGSGLGMAGWSDVALLVAGPYYEVVVAGDAGEARAEALWKVAKDLQAPWAAAMRIPQSGAGAPLQKLLPPTFGKQGKDGGPLAYVCVMGSCKKPTADPGELKAQMTEGWKPWERD